MVATRGESHTTGFTILAFGELFSFFLYWCHQVVKVAPLIPQSSLLENFSALQLYFKALTVATFASLDSTKLFDLVDFEFNEGREMIHLV